MGPRLEEARIPVGRGWFLAVVGCLVLGLLSGTAAAEEPPGDSEAPRPTRIVPRPGHVALTFDDGPDPEWTPVILDVLDQYDVKATFFVNGIRVAEYPEIASEVVRRGHSLQNHGYRHQLVTALSDSEVRREIVRSAETIHRQTGVTPTCFRPPWGKSDSRTAVIAAEVGETIVLWSVDSADYYHKSAATAVEMVLQDIHDGDVILMHDWTGWVARDALPLIIEAVRAAGLDFDTICDDRLRRQPTGPHYLRWGRYRPSME